MTFLHLGISGSHYPCLTLTCLCYTLANSAFNICRYSFASPCCSTTLGASVATTSCFTLSLPPSHLTANSAGCQSPSTSTILAFTGIQLVFEFSPSPSLSDAACTGLDPADVFQTPLSRVWVRGYSGSTLYSGSRQHSGSASNLL